MSENKQIPTSRKKLKIVVDEDHGIKEFGSETFESLIAHFVEMDYEEKKKDLEDSIKDKDIVLLKNVLHKLKTLLMYMNCVDLAELCKDISYHTQKGHENYDTAFSMVPEFISYFTELYNQADILYRTKYLQIPEEEASNKQLPRVEEETQEKKDPSCISEESVISHSSVKTRDIIRQMSIHEINQEVLQAAKEVLKENASESNGKRIYHIKS
jgi:hypothetical protein